MSYGMTNAEIAALQVGDEVGVCKRGSWESSVKRVTRRTKTQVTVTGGMRFTATGYEIGSSFRRAYLIKPDVAMAQAAEERAERLTAQARNRLSQQRWSDLTYEQCCRVQAVLDEVKGAGKSSPDAAATPESATTTVQPEEAPSK